MAAIGECYAGLNLPAEPVKLKILAGTPIAENVLLNGRGPYRFLLDTGAQTNMIEAALARELALPALFQTELITATGTSRVAGGRVERVSLGTAEAADQEFLFTNLDGVHAVSREIRGVLGQQFLGKFDYTLDFERRQLVFRDAAFGGAIDGGQRVPFRIVDGRMAIPTNLGDLVLDSGAGTMLLLHASPTIKSSEIRGSTGLTVSVSVGRAPELRIGARVYHPATAAFGVGGASSEDGLLPAILLKSIFICNSQGYVALEPGKRR